MNSPKQNFGKRLRERRLACGFGLRAFASLVEVSSTYISHLEQDKVASPTAVKTAKIAEGLGKNSDEWICFAGRIPHDFNAIILLTLNNFHPNREPNDDHETRPIEDDL